MSKELKLPEGWIPHDGGPFPVDPDSRPDMVFDNGPEFGRWTSLACNTPRKWRASHAEWSKCVAYRLTPIKGDSK